AGAFRGARPGGGAGGWQARGGRGGWGATHSACPSPGPRFARATLSPQERGEGTEVAALFESALNPEQLLERARGRGDRLCVGALLRLVLRAGEAVAGAAVDLELERHLGGAQLVDHAVDRGERKALVLGAVQDQGHAFDGLGPARCVVAERAVDRDVGEERRAG